MEFGYKASKEMFDVNKFGKWKFCNDKDIREIVGDNKSDMKISVMADVGRCDFKKDILNKKSQRDYIIFSLGINSGLRISDILTLDVKDVKNKII